MYVSIMYYRRSRYVFYLVFDEKEKHTYIAYIDLNVNCTGNIDNCYNCNAQLYGCYANRLKLNCLK